MANNGIFYSSGNSLNFTTSGTTWLSLNSQGLLSGLNLSMSAVTANTISQVNYIDFDTTPNVPSPTGGTLYFDSAENALSYKPITPSNDVTVNLGQETLVRIYNDLGFQINNGQALHITGSTSGSPTVSLAIGTGGDSVQFQISGIATHDIPDLSFGFITVFGVVRDLNPKNELKYLRIRGRKSDKTPQSEVLVAYDTQFIVIVIQKWNHATEKT
jgi:hypothetical protein